MERMDTRMITAETSGHSFRRVRITHNPTGVFHFNEVCARTNEEACELTRKTYQNEDMWSVVAYSPPIPYRKVKR